MITHEKTNNHRIWKIFIWTADSASHLQRVSTTAFHRALREVLANCLVNSDFYVPRGIVIKQKNDILIIENPGTIRVGKYQMKVGGESDPRNKALMKMFNLIGIGERAGSGVPELFSVWEQEGWMEPDIKETYNPGRTILTLPFMKKNEEAKRRKEKCGNKSAGTKVREEKCGKKNTCAIRNDVIYDAAGCMVLLL